MNRLRPVLVVFAAAALSCAEPGPQYPAPREPLPEPEMPADAEPSARIVHAAEAFPLAGSQETMTCYSWTLDNDAPLYLQSLEFQNGGSFHHSNWFVVPEDVYPGDDGFWPCHDRDFNDNSAALAGTVLFAQSTQAQRETMAFADGATIRIPARSKIVAGVHLLNLGPDPRETAAWLSLDVIHPALVESVLSPIMLSYFDLEIPPLARSNFVAGCSGLEFLDLDKVDLHYILPHYHRTGVSAKVTFFDAGIGTDVLDHQGFGASAMGRTFDPPLHFEDLSGIGFSCGYDNPHDETLTWGIGINEMCVFLAFADAPRIIVSGVRSGDSNVYEDPETGEFLASGACQTLMAPRSIAYDMPTREERGGQLILPGSDDAAPDPPRCRDADVDEYTGPAPSFAEVQERVFRPWCSFSSCHGDSGAGGLVLDDDDAEAELLGVTSSAVDVPRVAPGDPEGSYLYRLISECEPEVDGVTARHMPAGAPTLLDPTLVGLVRAWIENAPQ